METPKSLIWFVTGDAGQISVWKTMCSVLSGLLVGRSPFSLLWDLAFISGFVTVFLDGAGVKLETNSFWEAVVPEATEEVRDSSTGLHGCLDKASWDFASL